MSSCSSGSTLCSAPLLRRAHTDTRGSGRHLKGFLVSWCRLDNSHPIVGSFHHVNNSSLLRRGTNKFFEETIVTPIQYSEIKKLRHNPYVGGGYIRSHKTLFHDLHMGYWAKERMAAREERKKAMVQEQKRPRTSPCKSRSESSIKTLSSGSSSADASGVIASSVTGSSSDDNGLYTATTRSQPVSSSSTPILSLHTEEGQNSKSRTAWALPRRPSSASAASRPPKLRVKVHDVHFLSSNISNGQRSDNMAISASSPTSPTSSLSSPSNTKTATTVSTKSSGLLITATASAEFSARSLSALSSTGNKISLSQTDPITTFVNLSSNNKVFNGAIEEKLPHVQPQSRDTRSLILPASVLDVDHGKSRRFEDFYSFEKRPPVSIRVMPKLRAGSRDMAGDIMPSSTLRTSPVRSHRIKTPKSVECVRQLGSQASSGSMVGRGAYSCVRVGTHMSTGDRFAIKQISKRYLYSEEEREAIRREVRIHASPDLVHDNIVFLYDYFEDKKDFFLVMDHCEGGDLETYMRVNKRKGITELQAQLLFQQLMKALAFLHDHNIIHGDIKPQNVLLSKKPFAVVKICDFGNARYAKDVRYFSKTGSVSKVPYTTIMGTQGYIAPEILAKQDYSTGIDVWAAGVMCFLMLGGYQPFNPPSACLTSDTGPDFNDPVWKKYSPACRDFILRMLQCEPAKRITAADARTHPWIVGL